MRILFLADPIENFIKDHDSTWAMMLEAQRQGFEVCYSDSSTLTATQDGIRCKAFLLSQKFFELNHNSNESKVYSVTSQLINKSDYNADIDSFDYVMMRKDPPFDLEYLYQAQLLSQCTKAKVINPGQALANFNEKLSILQFPDLITNTVVSSNRNELKSFIQEHGQTVLKPLDLMGGSGIKLLNINQDNLEAELEESTEGYKTRVMIQKYIPEIKTHGDRRIIVINGKAEAGLLRIPKDGDFKANMAAGGSVADYDLTEHDHKICAHLAPWLEANGIVLAGIDLIGDYLTEINITSPTCFQEINRSKGWTGYETLEARLLASLS